MVETDGVLSNSRVHCVVFVATLQDLVGPIVGLRRDL